MVITMKAIKTTIRPIGNSQGVIIPKPLLPPLSFESAAEMTVEHGALVLRKPASAVRAGWAGAARKIAAVHDDALVMPEFANEDNVTPRW
jgi:antitoxin MazE